MRSPILVLPGADTITAAEERKIVEEAMARIKALLPAGALQRLALYLEAMALERENGGLEARFNTNDGRVCSADFYRRTHWSSKKKA
jgi:hypothetical protein